MTEEWGPWVEHDGTGCPVPIGTWVQVAGKHGGVDEGRVTQASFDESRSQWFKRYVGEWDYIIRYRIRKPRALEQLREIARNPERELEDA